MSVPVKTYHHRDISGTSATLNPITGRDILSLDALRCENSSLQYRSELSSLKDLWPSSRDPADRIIGATARAHGLPIMRKTGGCRRVLCCGRSDRSRLMRTPGRELPDYSFFPPFQLVGASWLATRPRQRRLGPTSPKCTGALRASLTATRIYRK